jgi:hypothetical protein
VLSRLSILEKNLTDRKISQVFIQFFDKKQEIPNVNLTHFAAHPLRIVKNN